MNLLLKENYSSENLWKKINLLSEDQIKILAKGLRWTADKIPDAVMVGGTAVVHYLTNNRKLTPDLDFLVDDISSVKELLNNENIKFNHLTTGIENTLGIVVNELNCDFLDYNVGSLKLNELILTTFKTAIIGGHQIRIINPELLAIMKFEIGRDRDLEDAFALLQSGHCKKENYISYLSVLKDCLHEYDSIHSYLELF